MKVKVHKVKIIRNRPRALLTKEDVQNAVINGILQAEEQRELIEKERIRNTKLTGWAIARLIFFSVVAAVFTILAVCAIAINSGDVARDISVAGQFSVVALGYVMLAVTDYALEKNKDKNFGFNVLSIMLALGSLIIAIFK